MNVSDFTPGKTYRMTIVPYLDYEPGEETTKVLTVLEPANAESSLMDDGQSVHAPPPALLEHWQKFLRVKDERGRVRLQWPEVIILAEVVAA